MEYSLKLHFADEPKCERCMLGFSKMGNDGETYYYCAALGLRPRCPEDGCRTDCPLEKVDNSSI